MSPENDKTYYNQASQLLVRKWLVKFVRVLMFSLVGMAVLNVFLVIWVSLQCYTIYGVSLEGRIFLTDSFTCKNHNVEPLFHHNSVIPRSILSE